MTEIAVENFSWQFLYYYILWLGMYDQSQRCCYILTTTQKLWIVIQPGITGWQEQSMRSLDEWYIAKTWKLWHVKPSIGSRILLDCVSARQNNRMEGWSQGVLLSNWSEWQQIIQQHDWISRWTSLYRIWSFDVAGQCCMKSVPSPMKGPWHLKRGWIMISKN